MLWCLGRGKGIVLVFSAKMPAKLRALPRPRLAGGTTTLDANNPSCTLSQKFNPFRITDYRFQRFHHIIVAVAVANSIRPAKDTATPSQLYRWLLGLPRCGFRVDRGLARDLHHYPSGQATSAQITMRYQL